MSAGVVGTGLGLYALAGFVLLPAILTNKTPALVNDALGLKPQWKAIHINPFSFAAEIEEFAMAAADGKPLVAFKRLALDVAVVESLQRSGLVLGSLTLTAPSANIERLADGRFNFSQVLAQSSAPNDQSQAEAGPMPLLVIHQLEVSDGQLHWSDASQGEIRQETVTPFGLQVSEFTTQNSQDSRFALELELASGGKLLWQGQLDVAHLSSSGQVQLDNLNLSKIDQLFLQQWMPLTISDGHLSLQSHYQLQYQNQLNLQLDQASIDLQQLQLADTKKPADTLISIPGFTVQGIFLDLQQQKIKIASVASHDGSIKTWLNKDGLSNYETLFATPGDAQPAMANNDSNKVEPAWQIQLDDLALNNYQIQFNDYQQAKPLEISLAELNLKLQHFKAIDSVFPVQLSTRVNQATKLNVSGNVKPTPFVGDFAVQLDNLKLKTFQPFVDQAVNLELVDGDLSSQGHLALNTTADLQVTYQGNANIDNLVTRDKVKNKDFIKWANLELQQMAIDVGKQEYRFGRVLFDKPYARFTIKKDGGTNVDDIFGLSGTKPNQAAKAEPAKTKAKSSGEPIISIASIEFKDGRSDFADYSLILPFIAEMNKLNGEVEGFSSNTDQAAKLNLKGKVYDLATVNIKGNYQFQSNDSNIALNFSHMPLPLVTPYMAEFAGYKIEKGQMALDLQYSIKDGQLDAKNKIQIDQLKLGDKVENPKAMSLPLELAVVLLRDADGKINLDFPISGSLEDPKFSIGSLVGDVLVNLIKKAVTSPFKALASLANGSEEDLSSVHFSPGNSDLSVEEVGKLGHVSEALASKPELTLEIKGMAYLVQDWPVLRADAVNEVLRKMKSGELRDKGEKIRSEYIQLDDKDTKRLLAKFYQEVLPGEIDFNVLGQPRMKNNPGVDFYSTARMQLEAIMQPEEQRLTSLAIARANSIANYLSEKANVDRGRIYFLATETQTGSKESSIDALLSLNVAQ